MRLSLDRMTIENFKGIRSLVVDFDSEETRIFGRNASGKTTLVDAFCWVLFNKDSHGNSPGTDAFQEKPLDDDGQQIHNIDTSVELGCKLDGSPFVLKRVQRENWTKRRGTTEAVYSGNVSTYWINGVEVKLADFKQRIALIANEEVFRLIGSLAAFNALDWKKRRQMLIDLSDCNVDSELMQRAEYSKIAYECGQRNVSVDDLRKIMADQRKRINKQLEILPARIDEAGRAIASISPREKQDAEYAVKECGEDIARINAQIASITSADGAALLTAQLLDVEQEIVRISTSIRSQHAEERYKLASQYNSANESIRRINLQIHAVEKRIEATNARLLAVTDERTVLRAKYEEWYKRKFVPSAETVCPTCGQPIPEDKVQEANEKARTAFLQDRAEHLLKIKAEGTEKSKEVDSLSELIEEYKEAVAGYRKELDEVQSVFDKASEALQNHPEAPDFDSNPDLAELQKKADSLRAKKTSPDGSIAALEERKAELNGRLKRAQAVLATVEAGKAAEERVKELERELRDQGDMLADAERTLDLLDRFVMDRCSMLEESINSHFPTVRWKLFDKQINGGIADTCICMIQCDSGLVTYDSANTAARINADIEIVNVLSEKFDVQLPLFVDNAERVNRLADTDSQLITLAVSTDEELRVESKMG